MSSEKRLKHMIQKYPELMLPLTSNNNLHQRQSKIERVVCRSLERSSRKRLKPSRRLSRLVIEDSLTCLVCKSILNVPVTLECGDTFCRSCLPEKTSTTCPECKRFVLIQDVKSNILVQDIVTRISTLSITRTQDTLNDISQHKYKLRSRSYNSYLEPTPNKQLLRSSVKRKRRDSKTDAKSQLNQQQQQQQQQTIEGEKNPLSPLLLTPSDVDCILCSRCLFEPVTTKCGHTFCRTCLARVLDYGLACPLCMAQLAGNGNNSRLVTGNGGEAGAVCKTLDLLIKRLLPLEHKERVNCYKEEIMAVDEDEQIPVFICTSAFPGVACPLFVYEPRYRLLTRRCLQTNKRRFAMAAAVGPSTNTTTNNSDATENIEGSLNINGRFAQYGTVLEVHDAVHLQDGTSILTTIGLRRFRVLSRGEKDGYDTAQIEYIYDSPIPLHSLPYLRILHDRVHRKATRWVKSLAPQIHAEIEQSLGAMPALESNWFELPDGPSWAWWLMPVLPLSAHLQVGFLSTCSLEKRLRAIDKLLDRMSVRMRARERKAVVVQPEETSNDNDSCAHANDRDISADNHAQTMEF